MNDQAYAMALDDRPTPGVRPGGDVPGAVLLDDGADDAALAEVIELLRDDLERGVRPRLDVLWTYYRNPVDWTWWRGMAELAGRAGSADAGHADAGDPSRARASGGPGAGAGVRAGAWGRAGVGERRLLRSGQERGLPSRLWSSGQVRPAWAAALEGGVAGFSGPTAAARREIVIENDIAWRIQTMVDFLVPSEPGLRSTLTDPARAHRVEAALRAVLEASGGVTLLQDAATFGHVYGWVDLLVRWTPGAPEQPGDGGPDPAERVRVEVIDPRRAMPVLGAGGGAEPTGSLSAYVLFHPAPGPGGSVGPAGSRAEVFTAHSRRVMLRTGADEPRRGAPAWRTIALEPNGVCPGRVPVVHVQNVSQPFAYAGLSEVEPLLALQDELNTRLSDRANRVTLQSFKMYLAKGLEGFDQAPVTPGTVWTTDNPDASITAFGGDADTPGEERHIGEIRDAMDKISGVPPLATGVVQAKIGNLSSESALRLTLQGLLTRTARKRALYGRGLRELCATVLSCLDRQGLLTTTPDERRVRVEWPEALPPGPRGHRRDSAPATDVIDPSPTE
jgi:hypothetical protein